MAMVARKPLAGAGTTEDILEATEAQETTAAKTTKKSSRAR